MKLTKENITNMIFIISYVLLIFYWMFSNVTSLEVVRIVAIKLSYVLLIICCIINNIRNRKKELIFTVIYVVITYISMKVSDSNSILLILLFLIAMKQMDFDKIVKIDFYVKLFFMICVIILYKLGFTENYYMDRSDGTVRSSMGFSHPNVFGTYVFLLCCEHIYLNRKNIKLFNYVILIICGLLVYYASDSRTAQFGILVLGILTVLYNKGIIVKLMKLKFVPMFFSYLFVLLTIISYVAGLAYINNNESILKFNNLVNNRIKMTAVFINNYDITLFGNDIELLGTKAAKEEGKKAKVLDNSYAKILLQYGILTYLMLASFFVRGVKKATKEEKYMLTLLLSLFCIYGIMENVLNMLQYNIFLLYFSNIIYERKEKNINS